MRQIKQLSRFFNHHGSPQRARGIHFQLAVESAGDLSYHSVYYRYMRISIQMQEMMCYSCYSWLSIRRFSCIFDWLSWYRFDPIYFLRSVISKDLNTKSDAESTVRTMMGLMIITIITGSESKIEAALYDPILSYWDHSGVHMYCT